MNDRQGKIRFAFGEAESREAGPRVPSCCGNPVLKIACEQAEQRVRAPESRVTPSHTYADSMFGGAAQKRNPSLAYGYTTNVEPAGDRPGAGNESVR